MPDSKPNDRLMAGYRRHEYLETLLEIPPGEARLVSAIQRISEAFELHHMHDVGVAIRSACTVIKQNEDERYQRVNQQVYDWFVPSK